MSKVAIQGDSSGSGTFTIASPNSNSNFTLTLPQASTTVVGTDATQTLTNKTINGSQLVAASVTSTQLATAVQPLGVGQTWQDVTASRAYGTTYTNSTGRPITVVISFSYNGSAAVLGQLTVDGVAIQFGQINSAYINVDAGTVIVPSGSTYVFTATSGSLSIAKWVELR